MNTAFRQGTAKDIIMLLRKRDINLNDSLTIIGVCASFFLHLVPKERRRDDLERWIQERYEAECDLERAIDEEESG